MVRGTVSLVLLVCTALPACAADEPKAQSLWFDPTQLPSFTGVVERYVPNPEGHIDRLVLKEGAQVAFPPDVFDAVRQVAAVGKPLVVWGIRARNAPIITMLAFAQPDSEPSVLDRIYWRPERGEPRNRREMMLIGTVAAPYLSPQGQAEGAILQNGDVVRVDPAVARAHKDRFAEGAKIVAAGIGCETPLGKAIDADRIGESVDKLEAVSQAAPVTQAGPSRPITRPQP